jgi:cytochrome c oxidase subunit II
MQASTPFHPASAQAAGNAHMFQVILVVCYIILALVTGLVVYASVRFRGRPGRADPPKQFGIPWMEKAWTIVPLLLLASMFGLTVATVRATDPYVPRDPQVIVDAHQFWWEFRYPKFGVITANELHIPVNHDLRILVESADVIHDFSVIPLARKMDAVPGYPNYMWLSANRQGVYLGACNEFCGAQHAWMRFKVFADSPDEFETWREHQATPALPPQTEQQRRGRDLFEQRSCSNCHTIRGVSERAMYAPDLTHVASRTEIAAGVLENTPENLYLWLQNPQAQKPGCRMPNMQLSAQDAHALTAYLENLK